MSTSAAAGDVALGKSFWTCDGREIVGTMTAGDVAPQSGGDVPAPAGSLTAPIPAGCYDGSTTCSMSDPGLVPEALPYGETIFGVTGSNRNLVDTGGTTAAASDVLVGKTAWVAGTFVEGSMVSRTVSASSVLLPAGYYAATSLDAVDADLDPDNICAGASLFGVDGVAVCGGAPGGLDTVMAAGVAHDRGAGQSVLADEYGDYALGASSYRAIPDVTKDDDAWQGTAVTKASHPSSACGTSGTVSQRIAACARAWDGATQGSSSEGLWQLVTRTAAGHEVWRDERTGLLWSDTIGQSNWCKASGNTQNAGGTDCSGALGGASYCTDDAYAAAVDYKGGLLAAGGVKWRLPTLSDLKLADIDGFRFVLPNLEWFWSATVDSNARAYAFVYNGWQGYINREKRDGSTTTHAVRCVGVAL